MTIRIFLASTIIALVSTATSAQTELGPDSAHDPSVRCENQGYARDANEHGLCLFILNNAARFDGLIEMHGLRQCLDKGYLIDCWEFRECFGGLFDVAHCTVFLSRYAFGPTVDEQTVKGLITMLKATDAAKATIVEGCRERYGGEAGIDADSSALLDCVVAGSVELYGSVGERTNGYYEFLIKTQRAYLQAATEAANAAAEAAANAATEAANAASEAANAATEAANAVGEATTEAANAAAKAATEAANAATEAANAAAEAAANAATEAANAASEAANAAAEAATEAANAVGEATTEAAKAAGEATTEAAKAAAEAAAKAATEASNAAAEAATAATDAAKAAGQAATEASNEAANAAAEAATAAAEAATEASKAATDAASDAHEKLRRWVNSSDKKDSDAEVPETAESDLPNATEDHSDDNVLE